MHPAQTHEKELRELADSRLFHLNAGLVQLQLVESECSAAGIEIGTVDGTTHTQAELAVECDMLSAALVAKRTFVQNQVSSTVCSWPGYLFLIDTRSKADRCEDNIQRHS